MGAWGRAVENSVELWISRALVDGVDNSAALSTSRAGSASNGAPVIHRFPRSMKERMKK